MLLQASCRDWMGRLMRLTARRDGRTRNGKHLSIKEVVWCQMNAEDRLYGMYKNARESFTAHMPSSLLPRDLRSEL